MRLSVPALRILHRLPQAPLLGHLVGVLIGFVLKDGAVEDAADAFFAEDAVFGPEEEAGR